MLERQFLTLLVVAGGAAAVFVWGSAGYHQRDQLKTWATTRCAAAGAPYTPPAKSKLAAGQACADRIDQLAAFERDTNASTAAVLSQAMTEQNQKISTDAALARSAAQAAAAATKRMEAENAAIKDDQVGGAWFGALNQSAGLRAPGR